MASSKGRLIGWGTMSGRYPAFAKPITKELRDRLELRIDPTAIISTGALANVSGVQVYSVEAAGTY